MHAVALHYMHYKFCTDSPNATRYTGNGSGRFESFLEHRRNNRASLVSENELVRRRADNRNLCLFRYKHRRHCFSHDFLLSNSAQMARSFRPISRLHGIGARKFDRLFRRTTFAPSMAPVARCRANSDRN